MSHLTLLAGRFLRPKGRGDPALSRFPNHRLDRRGWDFRQNRLRAHRSAAVPADLEVPGIRFTAGGTGDFFFRGGGIGGEMIAEDPDGPRVVLVIHDTEGGKEVGNGKLGQSGELLVADHRGDAFAFEDGLAVADPAEIPFAEEFLHVPESKMDPSPGKSVKYTGSAPLQIHSATQATTQAPGTRMTCESRQPTKRLAVMPMTTARKYECETSPETTLSDT